MLRTIALAGVHDGKSISFRVSLSGSCHETKFRAGGGERERERSGKGEKEFFVSAHKLHGQEEDDAPVRSADTEQEE